MAKDHEFDGERCRWYMNGSFYVSERGTKAYIAPKKGMTKSVTIENDGFVFFTEYGTGAGLYIQG